MGTPTVRELVTASNYTSTTSSATAVTGAGTLAADWLIAFHGVDYSAASGDIPTPTGSAGTWTSRTTPTQTGGNTTGAHLTIWTRPVGGAGGAQTVTVGINGSDSGVHLSVYVLSNLAASPFVDAASTLAPASATSAVAPSINGNAGDLLLCGWQSNYPRTDAFTIPGSMSVATSTPVADASIMTTGREVLASGGATGTRTATQPTAANYASASITIAGAASGAASVAAWVQPYTARRRAANF